MQETPRRKCSFFVTNRHLIIIYIYIIIIIIIIIINLEEKNSPKPERYSHDFGQVGVAESNVMLSLASHFDSMEAERCMAKMEMRRVKVGNTIITIITIIILPS